MQPGRRVQHHVRGALGRAHDVVVADVPALDRRQVRPGAAPATGATTAAGRRRRASPRAPRAASAPARLVASVLLPTPPLGLATTITGMRDSGNGRSGYGSGRPARLAPGKPKRAVRRHASRPCPTSSSSSPTRSRSIPASTARCCRPSQRAAWPGVEVRDLYALYPDYLIDVAAEQAALAPARLVVWQHPIHWYGMPPLMKLWLDEVFAFGWAYGPGGTGAARQGPVAGGVDRRAGRVVPARRLQPLLLRRLPAALRADGRAGRHALPAAAAAARRAPRRRGRAGGACRRSTLQRLASYPDWPEIAELEPCAPCDGARRRAAPAGRLSMEHGTPWLQMSLVYLGAAVLAVPLARLLGLGSIIGYLAAGIAIGPWGLKLVTDAATILHFAEFGVVLMLFLVGLELEPQAAVGAAPADLRLGQRADVRLGAADPGRRAWPSASTGGWRWWPALGLALSSTAIGLGVLNERNLMATGSGQSVLSVALLQDIAAIPILALLPLLAVPPARAAAGRRRLVGRGQGGGRGRADRARRPAGAAPGAALDRAQRHAGDLHRRVAAAGGGHRRADAGGGPVDGAGRLPGRRAAGRKRIPARAGDRPRALQGPAARPVLHRRGHEHRLRGGAGQPRAGGGARARLPAAQGAGAAGDGARDAGCRWPSGRCSCVLLAQGGEFGFVVFQAAARVRA